MPFQSNVRPKKANHPYLELNPLDDANPEDPNPAGNTPARESIRGKGPAKLTDPYGLNDKEAWVSKNEKKSPHGKPVEKLGKKDPNKSLGKYKDEDIEDPNPESESNPVPDQKKKGSSVVNLLQKKKKKKDGNNGGDDKDMKEKKKKF